MEQQALPEYTAAEMEQNAINNMRIVISDFEEMVEQGLDAEQIADAIHTAKYSGHKTLRYPPPRKIEPWRVNEIGIRS